MKLTLSELGVSTKKMIVDSFLKMGEVVEEDQVVSYANEMLIVASLPEDKNNGAKFVVILSKGEKEFLLDTCLKEIVKNGLVVDRIDYSSLAESAA